MEEVLQTEQELTFDVLTHQDIYNIAESILGRVRREQLGTVGIRAVVNGLLIFQYLMDGKDEEGWLKRKQKTVETFGHSGYYLWTTQQETDKYASLLNNERYAVCGGSFPIRLGNLLVGSFCVSGLAHDQDHQLIVDAFRQYQGEKKRLEANGYETWNSWNGHDCKGSADNH